MDTDVYTMKKEYRLGLTSFGEFAQMQKFVRENPKKYIVFDCTKTSYISPAFSTLFGSLPHYGKFYDKTVQIKYNSDICKRYIIDLGILKYYEKYGSYHKKAVPFTSMNWDEYERDKMKGINRILDQMPVKLSLEAKGVIISQLAEIFNNAKDHSGFSNDKNIRVYCCGHYTAGHNEYIVSIYDTGVGIGKNVSQYLNKDVSDEEAIRWAFGDGNSTQNTEDKDFSRGIGLNSLENFIKANNGTLYVCSGNAVCMVNKGKYTVKSIKENIRGTLYVFAIKVDSDHIYVI